MNDKKITKKWWFWVIIVLIVLGAFGAFAQPENKTESVKDNNHQDGTKDGSALPVLNSDDYIGKEGLVAYKELKGKGYKVNAEFENGALTDMNGKASDLFEKLDAKSAADRQSVDAYVVNKLVQDGKNVTLSIVLQPTN